MKASKPKLFSIVHCKAYLKQKKDTVRIQMYNPDGTFCDRKFVKDYDCKAIAYKFDPEKNEEIEIADLSEFDGSSVEKTYRERVEEEFDGVVVGYTKIKCKGLIGTDWHSDEYRPDFGFCFKETTEEQRVGVVYFKNLCRRYVPIDDMEEIDYGNSNDEKSERSCG